MTSDALSILGMLFGSIWGLFNSFYIPGTQTTPANFFFFSLVLVVSIRFLKRVFKSDVSSGFSGRGHKGDDV